MTNKMPKLELYDSFARPLFYEKILEDKFLNELFDYFEILDVTKEFVTLKYFEDNGNEYFLKMKNDFTLH